MPKLTIDDQEIEVPAGTALIQACEMLGIEIPRFCYHERLNIAGNCRMCLVEVAPGPPKPQASCAIPCGEGMVVKTNTPMVKKAREGVMEFLLINHPLDCPICDQGGECDLQDQAMMYGKGGSRYEEAKRAVEDKYMGPLIKTHMTRCIHCTRCIRFSTEIAGVPELGAFGRGEHMEVGTYVEEAVTSELSGNLVDICPVGALTSKPYAFVSRPWELKKTASIDVLDAVGSNIRVDSRGESVLRVLPRLHEDINEEWISDKTRHACDGLRVQRLDRPYIRNKQNKLVEVSWQEALQAVSAMIDGLQPSEMAALAGNLASVEATVALKDLLDSKQVANRDCRIDGEKYNPADRGRYLFNTGIANIEQADLCVIIGGNPRVEASMVNARIRKAWRNNGLKVRYLGPKADLNYPFEYLGNDVRLLSEILDGTDALAQELAQAKNPMLILGTQLFNRDDSQDIMATIDAIVEKYEIVTPEWNGYNVMHNAASRVGALDVGFVPAENGLDVAQIVDGCRRDEIKLVYLLGVDEFDTSLFSNACVIYQGHHGDEGAHRADVVLPSAAYTEQDATYVNMEGRPQRAQRAVFPPGQAKEDWAIIRALSDVLETPLPYNTLEQLRGSIAQRFEHLAQIDTITPALWVPAQQQPDVSKLSERPLQPLLNNFYMSDPISRASTTMAECTRNLAENAHKRVA